MTYDEIIEQLEITKSKIKEIARNEYGGESWNDDLDALTEAADIVADYSKAAAQASEMIQKYEQSAFERYPKYKQAYIRAFDKMLEVREAKASRKCVVGKTASRYSGGGLMKSGIQTRWKSRTGYTRSEQ